MSDPERWLTSADAPSEMSEMLAAAQKVGPTAVERAALAGKLGVATSGLWLAPALKGLAATAFVAGGVWMATSSGSGDVPVTPTPQKEPARLEVSAVPPVRQAPAPEVRAPKEEKPVDVAAAKEPDKKLAPSPSMKKEAAPPTEVSLIGKAKSSLESSPQRALSLLSQHAQLYPNGVLAEEREVLRIRALKKLGRTGAAQSQEQKFHEEHPESVHHVP